MDDIFSTAEETISIKTTNQTAMIATESVRKVVITTSTVPTTSIVQKSTRTVLSITTKNTPTILSTTPTTTNKPTTKPTPKPTFKTTPKITYKPTTIATTPSTILTTRSTPKPTIPTIKTTSKKTTLIIPTLKTTKATLKPYTIKIATDKPQQTTPLERIPLVIDTTEIPIAVQPNVPAFGSKNLSSYTNSIYLSSRTNNIVIYKYKFVLAVNEWNSTEETTDTDSLSSNLYLIITGLCLLVLSVPMSYTLYRKYRRFPSDYKNASRPGRDQRCSEFSEVRFLTEGDDEVVDF